MSRGKKPQYLMHSSERMREYSSKGGSSVRTGMVRLSETFDWDDAIDRFKLIMKEMGYR
jgi:hypothetical protein